MVKAELIHFHAPLLATMMRGLIEKGPLVTTVCMDFAEFPVHELQS